MSVILNEGALALLLETQEGPVGRFVEQIAGEIRDDAAALANAYYHDVVDVGSDIEVEMRGSSAIIGYRAGPGQGARDHKAQRLADKEREGMLSPPMQTAAAKQRR